MTAKVGGGKQATAWAYLVVSSEAQAETLSFQKRWATETAHQHGWVITETFSGVSSGRDGTRGLLKSLVDRLEKIPPSDRPVRVMMTRLDRLGRGLGLEALAAMAQITQLGVVIHTRQDGDHKIARASDSLLPLMRIVVGGVENEARRDKALDTYKRRRLNGQTVSNKRPYGITRVDGHDKPADPEAGAVRLAYELAANGFGFSAIGTRLRAVAPPKRYANGRTHEVEWTNDRVRKMLIQPAYRGVVVDEQQWDRVKRLLEGSPDVRSRKYPWPLSGALNCTCGRYLIGSLRGSPARRVYRCTAVKLHKRHRTYAALRIEDQFRDLLTELTISPKSVKEFTLQGSRTLALDQVALTGRRAEAIQEIVRVEQERTRVWRLNSDGLLPDVHLTRRLADIEASLHALRQSVLDIDTEIQRVASDQGEAEEATSLIREAASLWEWAEATTKAAAARSLARVLRGICVLEDGSLQIGPPTEWSRFYQRSPSRERGANGIANDGKKASP